MAKHADSWCVPCGTRCVVATSTCYHDAFASMEITFVVEVICSWRLRHCAKPGVWRTVGAEPDKESTLRPAWGISNVSAETSQRRENSLSRRWRGLGACPRNTVR